MTKPDWVIGGEGEAPAAETPDWVKSTPTPGGIPPPTTPASGSTIVGTTDWLKSFESPEKAAFISAFDASSLGKDLRKSDVSDLDWLTAIQPPSTPAPPPAPARPPTGPLTTAPTRTGTGPLGATTPRRATGPLSAPPPAESGIVAADLPPWLAALRPTGLDLGATPPPFTETPEWVKPLAAETSAISPDETIPGAPAFTTPPFTTTTASLAAVPAFTEAHGATEEDLAQANLPSWMRNLRPLNARAMAREVDLDRTENTGPLAGMRGVLPAESVIAIAGTPGAAVMGFMLSDAQKRRAELLRTLVQEETAEEAEIQPRKRKPFIYSFDRLLVALALLAAVVIPTLTATYLPEQYATFAGLFPSPSISASAQPLKDKIDGLPTDRPAVALVAFEYEPGYTGELNPGVASVLAQLMRHDVRIAAVSTYPTGPRVAQNVLDEVAAEVGVTGGYGRNYINLGYIPGGVSGLQQFVTDPTNAVTRDFRDGTDPWKGDVLKDFNELGKFDLIIIASASADSVQRWIEQVKRDGQPMAAITSAAAEPLVAPYASGDNRQLTGLVSGLSGAIGYDEATERKSDAAAQTAVRWSSYAFGLYTSAGALVVGAVFSTAALILASRTALPKKARPTAKAGSAASATAAQKPTARRTTAKRKGAAAKSKAAKPRLRQK